jgi:hypothetical protein
MENLKNQVTEVTKEQIEEVVNQLKVVGTLTELRKQVGEHFGWSLDKTKHKMNRLEVEIVQDEETKMWSSPTKSQTFKRNQDGEDMVEETLKVVELLDSGKTLKEISKMLNRHQGQVGRLNRFGQLVTRYKNIRSWIENGVISSGRVFQIQRSTKNWEKENSTQKGYQLQYKIIENLVKSVKQDKTSKGYVKNNHYEFLKSVETLPKDVVSSLFRIVGI